MRAVSVETLKESRAIYFEKIQQGIGEYPHRICSMNQKEVTEQIQALWINHTFQQFFVDFYYFRLKEEEKQRVDAYLSESEQAYIRDFLKNHENVVDTVIFQLDEVLLEITAKLNEKEILFSTYYFVGEQGAQTWWGNFNQQYIIFECSCLTKDGM